MPAFSVPLRGSVFELVAEAQTHVERTVGRHSRDVVERRDVYHSALIGQVVDVELNTQVVLLEAC